MGIVQRFERSLETVMSDAFARVFGGGIAPAEMEGALQREAENHLRALPDGTLLAPDKYVVTINDSDYTRFHQDEALTSRAFSRHLEQFILDQGWTLNTHVIVEFKALENLFTGQFRTTVAEFTEHQQRTPRSTPSEVSISSESTGLPAPGTQTAGARVSGTQTAGAQTAGAQALDIAQQASSTTSSPAYSTTMGNDDPAHAASSYSENNEENLNPHQAFIDSQHVPDNDDYQHVLDNPKDLSMNSVSESENQTQSAFTETIAYAHSVNEDSVSRPQQTPTLIASLILEDGSGRTYQLKLGANLIGRGRDSDFRLPDTGISRRHAEIIWDGTIAELTDLESTNGTTINEGPVQQWQLADGDIIRVGHSDILVRIWSTQ